MIIATNFLVPGSTVMHHDACAVILSVKKQSHFLWAVKMLRKGIIQRIAVEPSYPHDVRWSP